MEDSTPFKILFLCSGNSARSIMAEYLIKVVAPGKFDSYSAGSEPKGEVHPMTLRVLKEVHRMDCDSARSKDWDELKEIDFDFVITVCDDARETCPVWPGQPIVAHWGSQDPVCAEGSEAEIFNVFKNVSFEIRRRIEIFCSLPFEKLDKYRLEQLTKQIGMPGEEDQVKAAAKEAAEAEPQETAGE